MVESAYRRHHRIVYREQDGNIIIASCYGHYTDT